MKEKLLQGALLVTFVGGSSFAMEKGKAPSIPPKPNREIPTYGAADFELQGRLACQLQARIAQAMAMQEEGSGYVPVGIKIKKVKIETETQVPLTLEELKKKKPFPIPSEAAKLRESTYKKAFSTAESKSSSLAPDDLKSLMKSPDAGFESSQQKPKDDFIGIIGELEKLTRKGFKEADVFASKNPEPSEDFELLLEKINSKTDAMYAFKNTCIEETLDHPAISRLQKLVDTMSASSGKLVKTNAKLEHNSSFASYKVCVESLQTMLTKINPQQ